MPSSLCDSAFTTARRRLYLSLGIFTLALSFGACGGSRLTTDRAARELKPKEQLPERELRNLPNNMIIRIDNVADDGQSYKNYVVLRINGREVAPIERISNFSSTYSYPLRLQPGVYEIKGEYHAVGFWREHTYDIVTDETVKIMPNQRTVLEARLEKNHRGELAEKPSKFRISYENLLTEAPAEPRLESVVPLKVTAFARPAGSSNILVPPLRDAEERTLEPSFRKLPAVEPPVQVPAAYEAPVAMPVTGAVTTLQINTSPAGADVIVNDRYLGQAPVKITISKNQNHVIQISHQGYKEVVKILNAADLQNETLLQMVIKLETISSERAKQ
ncbi:MAG: PEGA domain-containing protein [bacterium]